MLLFQSRTLQSSIKMESIALQKGAHFLHARGFEKRNAKARKNGSMGLYRVLGHEGLAGTNFLLPVWLKKDGSGYIAPRKPRSVWVAVQAYSWNRKRVGKDSEESKLGMSHRTRSSTSTWAE